MVTSLSYRGFDLIRFTRTVKVFDISGRLMIDEFETLKYENGGMFREQFDLSSLKEGFYLLVFTDDEGAKMTRRVIKN